MRILVANDDGIHSPGLAMLARVAAGFGDVRVVAPDVEQSSASHAITSSRPLSYRSAANLPGIEAYRVNGTPADCVALGVHNWKDVDLVLSGVNIGVNLGNGMWHSGTLAAAKQATLFGLRGIALSTPSARRGGGEPDFDALAPHVEEVLGRLLGDHGGAAPQRQRAGFPARNDVDAPGGPPLRRTHRPGRGSHGPAPFLVHGRADRGDRAGNGPVGDGARLYLSHAAQRRPHRPRGARNAEPRASTEPSRQTTEHAAEPVEEDE